MRIPHFFFKVYEKKMSFRWHPATNRRNKPKLGKIRISFLKNIHPWSEECAGMVLTRRD